MSEWIPTLERVPKDGLVVLVAGGVAYFSGGSWWTVTGVAYPGAFIQWPVTHWMPLPAPPSIASSTAGEA